MQKLLITGANGFIGKSLLLEQRIKENFVVTGTTRKTRLTPPTNTIQTGDLDNKFHWKSTLQNIDVVIHTAAQIPTSITISREMASDLKEINVEGTLSLARQAAESGVKRLIFLSSIKVNGENTARSQRYTANQEGYPSTPYGISKQEAEDGLHNICSETGLEIVIIRPPLVYGRGVKGNFASFINLTQKGIPLPLGCTQNKRSLVGIDNLVDFIITCIDHPNAKNETFLVSDGKDISTTQMLKEIAIAYGRTSRLLPVPTPMLRLGAKLIGKNDQASKLLDSLQVDIKKNKELLNWTPPYSMSEQLLKMAKLDY